MVVFKVSSFTVVESGYNNVVEGRPEGRRT